MKTIKESIKKLLEADLSPLKPNDPPPPDVLEKITASLKALSDGVKVPYRLASRMMRSAGLSTTFSYSDSRTCEIGCNIPGDGGWYGMDTLVPVIEAFLKNKVGESARFQYFRGSSHWLARFKRGD